MRVPLTHVIKKISDYVDSNKVLKQFEVAPLLENSAEEYLYPMLLMEIGDTEIKNGMCTMKANLAFIDIPVSEDDYVQKLSDTQIMAIDFKTYFNYNESEFGFYLEDAATASPIQFGKINEDECIGWLLPINVYLGNNNDESQIPI